MPKKKQKGKFERNAIENKLETIGKEEGREGGHVRMQTKIDKNMIADKDEKI